MKTRILISALISFTTVLSATTLTLAPSTGTISGNVGSTVGWGFTLTNPSDFAVVSSSSFCLGTSGVTTLCEAPTLGIYSDEIAANFTIAGAAPESPVVAEAFNAGTATGLGSFAIASGASIGATNIGRIVVTYDLYSIDPLSSSFDPNSDLISAGNFLEAPAIVTVAPADSSVPEPSPRFLIALLTASLLLWSKAAKRSERQYFTRATMESR